MGYPGSFLKNGLRKKAIERIKMASEMSLHHYGKPLVCTYSGGKDSDVMLELFKRSYNCRCAANSIPHSRAVQAVGGAGNQNNYTYARTHDVATNSQKKRCRHVVCNVIVVNT